MFPVTRARGRRHCAAGFSLVELMVAMVAGLLVTGAVLAFAVSSMKSNADYLLSTRLTQGLRSTMDLVTRELRRAGYDEDSLGYLSSGNESSFSRMLLDNESASGSGDFGCVIFAYDRTGGSVIGGSPEPGNGEIRGFRFAEPEVDGAGVGVVEYAVSSDGVIPDCDSDGAEYEHYPATCNSATGWCALTDPARVDVEAFTIEDRRTGIPATAPVVRLRELGITLTGGLRGSSDYARTFSATVRVRSDCVDSNLDDCKLKP